ncbi:gag-pol polyprotein [Cucumis melo var. makuwa]|uniref:Gag-pol polyprotein n=1 Tax=Cucumis melo var. makuwa TaxID=1194695 RepID=A0A5A7SRQ8_CUCMM|nr:gag-pol polyprotein [Cucumis melo var. makuwa]TYJ98767.1 gag-pol polyprotein [Cucumis melo var. makuwa]
MEIIREGPSASRPPVLDGKNYSYWKPRMIFFIKTLHGKAWRALVASYDPPMITVNGVAVPKPEVDWIDAEEQTSVRNARAFNSIFNCTSKVKISRLQLITSKFEALRMNEDESVSDYNKRVLEIANESLLLCETIPDSKIVRKVVRSLPSKFDMKVTAIEEAHDITTLKLDELFGSLLTFEMATADRESKKGKGIAFKSTHVSEEAGCDTEANMDESIALLTKQFTNALQNLKSPNATDEESVDSRDDDGNINAFTIQITDENTDDDSECLVEGKNDELSIEKLETLWKEDCEARAIQKERFQDLLHKNERLMYVMSSLKLKFRETADDAWYFDSGCSRHMTGNRSYFTNINDCVTGNVTFGDGAKENIIAKGNIHKDDLPRLNDVRYTWVCFLKGKTDTVEICKNLCLKLQHEKGKKITRIRTDHGKEFDNEGF